MIMMIMVKVIYNIYIYIYTYQFYFLSHSFLLVEQLPISSTAATAVATKEDKQLLRRF